MTIPRRQRSDAVPLSFAQQRLWFLEQLTPGTAAYNMPLALRLVGPLDPDVLRRTIGEIVRRHESVRTGFEVVDGIAAQRIAEPSIPELPLTDLSSEPGSLQQHIRRLAATPIPLDAPPLLRQELIRTGDDTYIYVLVLHHIAADGWSLGVVCQEVSAIYPAFAAGLPSPLDELPIQYADFGAWQRERFDAGEFAAELDYWRTALTGTSPLALPTDPTSDAPEETGDRVSIVLPPEIVEQITLVGRAAGATPFMTFLAAFGVLLHRWSGQSSITIGTPVAGRNQLEIEKLIGFFVNTFALPLSIDGDAVFADLLKHTRTVALGAYRRQNVPFEKVVEEVRPDRGSGGAPMFQAVFAFQNTPQQPILIPGIEVTPLDIYSGSAKFDLILSISRRRLVDHTEALVASLEYATALIDRTFAAALLDQFGTLLAAIVTAPDRPLRQLGLVSPAERERLIALGARRASFPVEQRIEQLFATQVCQHPDRPALTLGGVSLTYAELDDRAARIASALRGSGTRPGDLVGLFLDRSFDLVASILGILKAGCGYVPLDPAYPASRCMAILSDAQPTALITTSTRQPLAFEGQIIDLDRLPETAEPVDEIHDVDAVAYVIYTSGSTGAPKGVPVSHRNVVRLFSATTDLVDFRDTDVWTLFHSCAFDFSVWELWGALLYGGRLVVVPSTTARSPEDFYALVCRERVTVLNQTPSSFTRFAQADERMPQDCSALKVVVFGGEALEPGTLRGWFARHPDAPTLINMYGITETTVHVTAREITAADVAHGRRSPIGAPLPDLDLYVLDERLQPVPVGFAGELCVGGAGVAGRYLNAPELSARRFVPHPFARDGERLYRSGDLARRTSRGDLEYLGRVDHQIKVRGFRIEAGEIESHLLSHPAVSAAVVVAHEGDDGDKRLAGYLVVSPCALDAAGSGDPRDDDLAREWQLIFDETYGRADSQSRDGSDFNITGWDSSYTNAAIPEADMREWVERTVERISALRPRRVLEIGSGTGLLMHRLAGATGDYVGTDISAEAVRGLRAQLPGPHVQVLNRPADEFDGLPDIAFDTVILNSVAQYFPSLGYLVTVLDGAVRRLDAGGRLFVGDIRDLRLQRAFHLSVELHRADGSMPCSRLRTQLAQRLADEDELVLDPEFFGALAARVPAVTGTVCELKRGVADSEMNRFRFDATVSVGGAPVPDVDERRPWHGVDDLRSRLSRMDTPFIVDGLRNARVANDVAAVALLEEADRGATVTDLRNALRRLEIESIDPEELGQLANDHGWDARLTPAPGDGADFTATFTPTAFGKVAIAPAALGEAASDVAAITTAASGDAAAAGTGGKEADPTAPEARTLELAPDDPIRALASDPLRARRRRRLVPAVIDHLRDRVPDYMVPAAMTVLDDLPLTANGKVDRDALPTPALSRTVSTADYQAPRTPTETLVASVFAQLLGVTRVGVHDSFFDLGGHSLLATQVVFRLRDDRGIAVPLAVLFETPTAAGLAAAIDAGRGSTDIDALLRRDAVLPADVGPGPVRRPSTTPPRVLVTGATGFLGAYVAHRLITRLGANAFCLVRADDPGSGRKRLQTTFERYGLWDASIDARIHVLAGDLARPGLGISPADRDLIGTDIDAIYHVGAAVNLVYPYEQLRAANVDGTIEILRMAAAAGIPVHYVSTVGVFASGPQDGVIREADDIGTGAGLRHGYTQSKWVAEQRVHQAIERGLPVTIYRPSRICGDAATGACQSDDFLWRLVKGSIQVGLAPAADASVDLVPVDYAADAIVELSTLDSSIGHAFHLANPAPVRLRDVVGHLRALGYRLDDADPVSWRDAVAADPTNAAYPLLGVVSGGGVGSDVPDVIFDASATGDGLTATDVRCPPIDRALIARHVDYFTSTGYLPLPSSERTTDR